LMSGVVVLGAYRRWYNKMKYARLTIFKEDYRLLKELCRDESIVDCVHRILTMVSQKREVEVKATAPVSPPTRANPSSKASSSPPTGSKVVTPSSTKTNPSSESEKPPLCMPKTEVRNLKAYVESLRRKGVLRDWWEEEDRYCFDVVE